MKLSATRLAGLGQFNDRPASFTINRFRTPAAWEYQLNNGLSNLRLRQDGAAFFQIAPPGGPLILSMARDAGPSMFTWILTETGRAFTNFYQPTNPPTNPGAEPQEWSCTYDVEAARYHLKHDDLVVDTEVFTVPGEVTMVMRTTLTNASRRNRTLTLMPVCKPHMASVALAPWDYPAWYQTIAYTTVNDAAAFWMEMRDPGGNPARRFRAAMVSDFRPTTFEVSMARFVGNGRWELPQAIFDGKLARSASRHVRPYGKVTADNAVEGQIIVGAMARQVKIAPGKSFSFTTVLGLLPETTDGTLPAKGAVAKFTRFFDEATRNKALKQSRRRYEELFNQRRLNTPDEALNQYVNEFVALQLLQVMDRGWTNMHGVRDTAQDATAIVPIDPARARERLIEILSLQRTDGWFLRQYSTAGKHAKHDARPYVDSGLWVWELIWEYLVWTRDFALPNAKTDWLDSDAKATILDHTLRIFDYFLDRKNIGEHGLCKIREGDWNDSVNAAGLEGRGESVMVSAHLVLALRQAADLLRVLAETPAGQKTRLDQGAVGRTIKRYEAEADRMRQNLLKHARNREGYFNAVFTDAGQWCFSPRDLDGRHRINSTPNTFAIIAGVVTGRQRDQVFDAMEALRGPYGWRLFHPAISGDPPIHKLGRIGAGDLVPGIGENGCPYNHGSHGFLARAAFTAGKGDLFYQVMRYMLPYDQAAHPVAKTKSPPYLIVNNYLEALGLEGNGGYAFQTGSIPVAARNCFDGFLGFRPDLRRLVIDPVVPASWKQSGGEVTFLGGRYTIRIRNPRGKQCGVSKLLLDGQPAGQRFYDDRLDRYVIAIPLEALGTGRDHSIEVTLDAKS